MKLVMFFAKEFWYRTFERTLPTVPETQEERGVEQAVVVFFQAEAEDEDRAERVLTKLIKNIKWLCGKFGSRRVVFHSFNHLGASRSSPEFAQGLVGRAMDRLSAAGFEVAATPFGYLNEWRLHVLGDSLAKVFKQI